MMKPHGVQIRRGKKFPANTKSVTRPSIFGNPFPVSVFGHARAVRHHRRWLLGTLGVIGLQYLGYELDEIFELTEKRNKVLKRLPELKGYNLGCYCRLGVTCHRNTLLELSNKGEK